MKRILKSRIFLVILTVIITSVIGVSASILYQASEIGFTPENSDWEVNNLESALNDLYTFAKNNNSGGNVIGEEHIILNESNTYQLPLFSTFTWVSEDSNKIAVTSNGNVTVAQSGDVYLTKNGNNYFKYSFDYRGPVITFTAGVYYSTDGYHTGTVTSNLKTVLTDGIKTKQGGSGALMLDAVSNSGYLSFTISRPVDITFSSGYYGDGGGSSGKTAKFYKINSNNEEELYTSFVQQNNSVDYQTEHFEPGNYKLKVDQRYLEFDEWTIVETN